MRDFTYVIKDPVGLHARPAGLLVKKAGGFASRITIESEGKSAEAKKLIMLMGLGIKQEVVCRIEGEDEDAAYEALAKFFEENL